MMTVSNPSAASRTRNETGFNSLSPKMCSMLNLAMLIYQLLNLVQEKCNQNKICKTPKFINGSPSIPSSYPLPSLLRAWDRGYKQEPENLTKCRWESV